MRPEVAAAYLRWMKLTQLFWSGAATETQLIEAEDAYQTLIGRNIWIQGATDAA